MRYQVRVTWDDGGHADTAAFGAEHDARQWCADVREGLLTLPSGMVRCPSNAVLLGPREGMNGYEILPVR